MKPTMITNASYWHDKPYYSLNYYLKESFGDKVYKISLNGGMSCPNRDGKLDTRGCIFCSEGGSGDFASEQTLSISEQIETGKQRVARKTSSNLYIAYFQAFTNTYASPSYLKGIFSEAIAHPDIVALSIATRPDCLSEEILQLLSELNQIKPIWIELGLQTVHEKSANYIRRGYSLSVFDEAVIALQRRNLTTIVHLILGLPNETKEHLLASINHLNMLPIHGVKLQLLHILKNTDLAADYQQGYFDELTLAEYIDWLITAIEHLAPDKVIHRISGDGPKNLLIAPLWSGHKKHVLNSIHKEFKKRNTWQGKKFKIYSQI